MNQGRLTIHEHVLFWAFRYALGRATYAVDQVADEIIANAGRLTRTTRRQIIAEIQEAQQTNALGLPIDRRKWLQVEAALAKADQSAGGASNAPPAEDKPPGGQNA